MWTTLIFKTSLEAKQWTSANTHIKWWKTFDVNGHISIQYFVPNKLKTNDTI
jgi:hypothetical protein